MEIEMLPLDLIEHPAVRAWRSIQPAQIRPARIEILKGKHDGRIVFRLEGMGWKGEPVIAKRCRKQTGFIERTIYEQVLPHLPLTVPRYYGFAEEEGEFCWLFLEDVGAERFSLENDQHRVAAARWLGRMHTAAASLPSLVLLPDRGSHYYLEHLQIARERILQNLGNSMFVPEVVTLLKKVVSVCDLVETYWDHIVKFCEQIPSTLVHGDFRPKNIHVIQNQDETALFPMDWEMAGWGVPAADLAPARSLSAHQVDLALYYSIFKSRWPGISLSTLVQLVGVGRVFRRLAAIDWASLSLETAWPEKAIAQLRIYHEELSETIQAKPWAG